MKKTYNIFILAILSFFGASCEKEDFSTTVEVDLSEYGEQLVVLALFKPDYGNDEWSRFYLLLVQSNDILNESRNFTRIENADVQLFEEGEYLLNLEHWKNGIYLTSNATGIEAGKSYELKIHHHELGKVTAQSSVPDPVHIVNAFISDSSYYDVTDDREKIEITLTLEDTPNEENYYFLFVETYHQTDSTRYRSFPRVTYTDPIFEENIQNETVFGFEIDPNAGSAPLIEDVLGVDIQDLVPQTQRQDRTLTFQDAHFDGEQRTIKFYIHKDDLEGYVVNFETEEKFFIPLNLRLVIGTMSRELYLYKRSAKRQSLNDENPFAEPTRVFSNIEGGMGIFGGFVEDTIELIR